MIAKHLRETIERDAARKMVHMMPPDIAREPRQGRWQFIGEREKAEGRKFGVAGAFRTEGGTGGGNDRDDDLG